MISVARANGLRRHLRQLIWQESGFDPRSVSRAGAQGIAQFMPETGKGYGLVIRFDPIHALMRRKIPEQSWSRSSAISGSRRCLQRRPRAGSASTWSGTGALAGGDA